MQTVPFNKLNASIGLLWLFHVSGIIGIIYGNAQWFVQATPINLTLSFILLLLNMGWNRNSLWVIFTCYSVGMLAEIMGVYYGFIFGSYSYGATLGPKVFEVPWVIGLNWCILIIITASIARAFFTHFWASIGCAVGLMLFLDVLIEPMAPVLDFWTFETGLASFHNYLGWALVALPLQVVYQRYGLPFKNALPFHLYLLQLLFFVILLLKVNSIGIQ